MVKFNGAEIFTIEELNDNARIEAEREKLEKQGFRDITGLVWKKQTLKEWDDTVNNVEVAEVFDEVLVKYEDGTIYREDRGRFRAGKWAESPVTEAFRKVAEQSKEIGRFRINKENYFEVFRNGDITRVTREELIVKEVVMVNTGYTITMKGELS